MHANALLSSFLLFFLITYIPGIEENYGNHAHSDCGIGYIEYRVEEREFMSAKPWHPRRPCEGEEGKIKHVDHKSVKHPSVALSPWHQPGHCRRIRIRKKLAIAYAVDDVAECAGCNQSQTCHISAWYGRLANQTQDIPYEQTDKHNAEKREKQFASELYAECHAVVLYETQMKPPLCCDIEVEGDDVEQRYEELKQCLMMKERFEVKRLV